MGSFPSISPYNTPDSKIFVSFLCSSLSYIALSVCLSLSVLLSISHFYPFPNTTIPSSTKQSTMTPVPFAFKTKRRIVFHVKIINAHSHTHQPTREKKQLTKMRIHFSHLVFFFVVFSSRYSGTCVTVTIIIWKKFRTRYIAGNQITKGSVFDGSSF